LSTSTLFPYTTLFRSIIRWGITLPNGVRRSVRGSQRMLYRFHHVFISHKYGSPLMEAVRLYIQDAPLSIAGLAASLLHDKCQGVALIHQPEFPFGMRHRGWVEKDAALDEVAVHVCHHRPDIARSIGPPRGLIG